MQVEAALVKEQGLTFAVVVVKRHVTGSPLTARDAIAGYASYWPGVPVVLMSQGGDGTPTFYGRPDIVRFLKDVPVEALPWGQWQLN